jgi:hypothetical protein
MSVALFLPGAAFSAVWRARLRRIASLLNSTRKTRETAIRETATHLAAQVEINQFDLTCRSDRR